MAGTKTLITTKSGAQLLYVTNGLPMFNTLPKSTITGERIEGAFINSAFKTPKIRSEVSFAEEIVRLVGEVSTEAQVRAAFEKIKARLAKSEAAPKKAKATTAMKRAPRVKAPEMPSQEQLDQARFNAAMAVINELREKMSKVA